MKTEKTICLGCGKQRAKGGHRFCYACIGEILSAPSPPPPPRRSM
jgi:hypothetical protein